MGFLPRRQDVSLRANGCHQLRSVDRTSPNRLHFFTIESSEPNHLNRIEIGRLVLILNARQQERYPKLSHRHPAVDELQHWIAIRLDVSFADCREIDRRCVRPAGILWTLSPRSVLRLAEPSDLQELS